MTNRMDKQQGPTVQHRELYSMIKYNGKEYHKQKVYITEGNGNPLQYSCLENPMGGGTWQATVHGAAKSWTQLSNFTSLCLTAK